MRMLQQVWQDEAGFVVSTELVLVATILVIGMVVGLATVRNAVVQELGDVALAIANTNQSFQYSGVTGRLDSSATAGSFFTDNEDFCDRFGIDGMGTPPSGITLGTAVEPIKEGTLVPGTP